MDYLVNQRTPTITANFPSRSHGRNGRVLAYAAVALIAMLATIYFAFGGPGMTEDQIALAAVWP
jgi:hypothetical protein